MKKIVSFLLMACLLLSLGASPLSVVSSTHTDSQPGALHSEQVATVAQSGNSTPLNIEQLVETVGAGQESVSQAEDCIIIIIITDDYIIIIIICWEQAV